MSYQISPDELPDYHFLLLAANLEAVWMTQAARLYWQTFRATVIPDGELLRLVPPEATVAVSVLTREDAFRTLAVIVAQARPDAYLDALVYPSAAEAQVALDARAELNQPFGVPLRPTPVPPTRAPAQPTPGAVTLGTPTPQQNLSGFITQTPTPATGFITQTPTPTDDPDAPPTTPTPGAILGG
jgi:hypothetical protein